MRKDDFEVTEAMLNYGGRFVVCLAKLARACNARDLKRLKATFPEYWEDYDKMAKFDAENDAYVR